MFIQQFFEKGLSSSSYILGGREVCAVIDPGRDIQIYLDEAEKMGLKITHILETHLHADFISGHMDLALATGAKIVGSASAGYRFEHMPVKEGDHFTLEHLKIEVIETPGHTPEHISFIVTDTVRGGEPGAIFCGDTLFVGDVGRPDLFPGRSEELAGKLFDSIRKIMSLPDYVEVYPAHGAGSLCGKAISAKRSSTVGYERKYNRAIQPADFETFKSLLLKDMPSAPDHFSRCSAINRDGPALVKSLPVPSALGPDEFKNEIEQGALVVDIREPNAFGGLHIKGAVNISINGNFATFSGWILPVDRDILLVADCPGHVEMAVRGLRSVGLDRVTGYLAKGMASWTWAGYGFAVLPQVSVYHLRERCSGGIGGVLLDVRAPGEFEKYHIDHSFNIPAPDLRIRHSEIDKKPVYLICSSGHRSGMAASLLLREGVEEVYNVAGGLAAWASAGFSRVCSCVKCPHGPEI